MWRSVSKANMSTLETCALFNNTYPIKPPEVTQPIIIKMITANILIYKLSIRICCPYKFNTYDTKYVFSFCITTSTKQV